MVPGDLLPRPNPGPGLGPAQSPRSGVGPGLCLALGRTHQEGAGLVGSPHLEQHPHTPPHVNPRVRTSLEA